MNYLFYYYEFEDGYKAFIFDRCGYKHTSELGILVSEHGSIVYSSCDYSHSFDVLIINGVNNDE